MWRQADKSRRAVVGGFTRDSSLKLWQSDHWQQSVSSQRDVECQMEDRKDSPNYPDVVSGKLTFSAAELANSHAASEFAELSALELLLDTKDKAWSVNWRITPGGSAAALQLHFGETQKDLSITAAANSIRVLAGNDPPGTLEHGTSKYDEPFVRHRRPDNKVIASETELCAGPEDGFSCQLTLYGADGKAVVDGDLMRNGAFDPVITLKSPDSEQKIGKLVITERNNPTDGSITGAANFVPEQK